MKDFMLRDYLRGVDDDDLILFTDGFDTLMMCGEDEIKEKFDGFNKDLVMSAETQCWPDKNMAGRYPTRDIRSPYKYINSGGFIGRAGFLKELLSNESFYEASDFEKSNQYLWTLRYFANIDRIGLDVNCEIFCSFSPEIGERYINRGGDMSLYTHFKINWFKTNFSIEGSRVYNKITKTYPCNLHFNGDSKRIFDDSMMAMVFSMAPGSEKITVVEHRP